MGFSDEMNMEIDNERHLENVEALFEEHLSFDEMVLGIKSGKYF